MKKKLVRMNIFFFKQNFFTRSVKVGSRVSVNRVCFRRERERLFEEKMLYYIARISHSGTPTIRPQKYISEKYEEEKMGWFIAAAAAALSPPYRDEKPNNNNTGQKGHQHREEKTKIRANGLEKIFSVFVLFLFFLFGRHNKKLFRFRYQSVQFLIAVYISIKG